MFSGVLNGRETFVTVREKKCRNGVTKKIFVLKKQEVTGVGRMQYLDRLNSSPNRTGISKSTPVTGHDKYHAADRKT